MTEKSIFRSEASSEVIEVLLSETDIAIDAILWCGNKNSDKREISLLKRFAAGFGFYDLCNSLDELGSRSNCLSTRILLHYEKAKQSLRQEDDASPSI